MSKTLHPCIRAGRCTHRMRIRGTDVLEQVVPLMEAGHPAAISWAGRSRDENHTGLQIFADGEWHPVVGWTLTTAALKSTIRR